MQYAPVGASSRQWPVVAALGTTQTLAWASSYYLPAILADPIAHDLCLSSTWVFAAFSGALLTSALLGPGVGRWIDALGGRRVLCLSNFVFAAGLVVLGLAQGQASLWLAWVLLGAGMGLGLYDAAFAALGRIYGMEARSAITGITLFAGFASTVGWPLTAWAEAAIGWRGACFAWAALHLLVGFPLNRWLLPAVKRRTATHADTKQQAVELDATMGLLAFAFAAGWTVTAAMAAHLPRLLETAGATSAQAIAAGMLIGPAQVAARIFEAKVLHRFHPLLSARLAASAHPLGAAALLGIGATASTGLFALLHGAGNGILTIARGTVPLAIYGPVNYGHRLGLLGAPSRIAQSFSPLLFGVLIERLGSGTLIVSSALSLSALIALCMIRAQQTDLGPT